MNILFQIKYKLHKKAGINVLISWILSVKLLYPITGCPILILSIKYPRWKLVFA